MKAAVFSGILRLAVFCAALFFVADSVQAEELKLKVTLIWGTNDKTDPDPKHKPVDPELAKKLGSIFKWKHYFAVTSKDFTVANRGSKKILLSGKCEVMVTELEGTNVEVQVFGDGKHVKTVKSKLSKQETLTIAGDDKNECAWFIFFQQY